MDDQTPGLLNIYGGIFGNKVNGRFVEIGAHDGVSWSCTVELARAGWTGLYVEPMDHLYQQCVENHKCHPNITVARMAVGDGSPINMMHDYSTSWFFSGDPDFARAHGATEYKGTMPTVTMDMLLDLYSTDLGLKKHGFDLLVIDVEGMEVAVLKGLTLSLWMPRLVVIELHEQDPSAEVPKRTKFANDYFGAAGYQKIYTSPINSIFMSGASHNGVWLDKIVQERLVRYAERG